MLLYSSKYKWSLPSELREFNHVPALERSDTNLPHSAVLYRGMHRLGAGGTSGISGKFVTDGVGTALVYRFSADVEGQLSVADVRSKLLKNAVKLFVDVSKSLKSYTHQMAVVNIDNIEAGEDANVEVDINQSSTDDTQDNFDLALTSSSVTSVIEKTVDSYMQVFKNENVHKSTFVNAKKTESNLITSIINAFSSDTAPATIDAVINKKADVNAAFAAERSNILNNKNLVNMGIALKSEFSKLANQLASINITSVSAVGSVVIRASVNQFTKNLMKIIQKIDFVSVILTAIDQTASFSVAQDLKQSTDASHNISNESIKKDETFSKFLMSGALLVGAIAVFLIVLKFLR